MILSPRALVPILKQHVISCHTFFRLSALKSEPVNLLGVNILRDTKTTFLTPKGTMSTLSFYMGVSPPPLTLGKSRHVHNSTTSFSLQNQTLFNGGGQNTDPQSMDYPNGLP